ncbi:hypothetical protein LQ757_05975 [Agromyces sp. SYSU K20354]|uniref:hypothetical protein n=1 Tax=Agromyces cavernae TaxID=2898659 RepID=UPI001E56E137|nr:hypothetical protein [Agromyces cavernae]MCD2441824.1 hypothetical protein [Agromyces cavernae]
MVDPKKLASALALLSVAVLLLVSGCATRTDESSAPTPSPERVFTDPDCGTFGIVESAPDLGAESRREVLEVMIRGQQRALDESPDAVNTLGFTPEDALMALEAALTVLPDVEKEVGPDATVTVPAVNDAGTYLGEFVIRSQNGKYVFDTILIAHEGGIPCATE